MVDIELFGRITDSEQTDFTAAQKDADKLAKGLHQFSGIVEVNTFIAKIDAANLLIDNLVTFKTTLDSIKTTLENA